MSDANVLNRFEPPEINNSSNDNHAIFEGTFLSGDGQNLKRVSFVVNTQDLGSAGDALNHFVMPVAGTITNIRYVIQNPFTGTDSTVFLSIAATPIVNGSVTFTQSGSAAGDVETALATADNIVAVGDVIIVNSDQNASLLVLAVSVDVELS